MASVGLVVLAGTVTSGFEVDGERVRSWWGWGGIRMGRWHHKPQSAPWCLHRTRESLMNRRGAARSVGIESWDLGWFAGDEWHSVHEFTDQALAQAVASALNIH